MLSSNLLAKGDVVWNMFFRFGPPTSTSSVSEVQTNARCEPTNASCVATHERNARRQMSNQTKQFLFSFSPLEKGCSSFFNTDPNDDGPGYHTRTKQWKTRKTRRKCVFDSAWTAHFHNNNSRLQVKRVIMHRQRLTLFPPRDELILSIVLPHADNFGLYNSK